MPPARPRPSGDLGAGAWDGVSHQSLGNFGVVRFEGASPSGYFLPSAEEMAALDNATIAAGVSGLELMERAGSSIASWISEKYSKAVSITVLCGPGNNGGDGLVIARVLRERGYTVAAILAASERYSHECFEQTKGVSGLLVFGVQPGIQDRSELAGEIISEERLRDAMRGSRLVIDALLGTGQRRAPRGSIGTLVTTVMEERERVGFDIISVDIPTGVDADTGGVFEPCVRATTTLTVEFVKRGMLQYPARSVCGDIHAIPIGIVSSPQPEYQAVHERVLPAWRKRGSDVHKGDLGRILVIGGSQGMPGAPLLAALGALRAGAGIVSRVSKRHWHGKEFLAECMCEYVDGDDAAFADRDVERVLAIAERFDAVVVGPGLGQASSTRDFVLSLCHGLKGSPRPVVVDADALNALANTSMTLSGIAAIISPHPGEASRLLARSVESIQADRFTAARELWEKIAAVSVLKGAGTIVRGPEGGRVIPLGTPYMATPGSGDVLSGILAVCCLRTRSLLDAASLGVWIHARAGVRASERTGGTILASEIAESVAEIIGMLDV